MCLRKSYYKFIPKATSALLFILKLTLGLASAFLKRVGVTLPFYT